LFAGRESGDVASSGGAVENVEGVVSVTEAVMRELEGYPVELAESALAATAIAMAELIDDPGPSATSKSMCAGKLIDALRVLRELRPADAKRDAIDDLTKRRAKRRSASKASARS
jgi:hypothetical protein